MWIKHDKETDAKYIRLSNSKVARTGEIKPWLLCDRDIRGKVVGVEVLEVSKHPVSISVDISGNIGIGNMRVVETRAHGYAGDVQDYTYESAEVIGHLGTHAYKESQV